MDTPSSWASQNLSELVQAEMATSFSSLPIVDLSALQLGDRQIAAADRHALSRQLHDVFATTGFAYLINAPLSFSHEEVFDLAREFFGLPLDQKMELAKKSFQPQNENTYRGYFPTQPFLASDNLKEGFEIGPKAIISTVSQVSKSSKFNFSEANVWPSDSTSASSTFRSKTEQFYAELQTLASQLLSLLAISLGKEHDFFTTYLVDSLSTLRLLHYPPTADFENSSASSLGSSVPDSLLSTSGSISDFSLNDASSWKPVQLSCTPHTDSGIITLLHQDPTGGLEVQNAVRDWIPAPYIPGSIVVNIGDLMAEVSGGKFVATMHRVRAPPRRKLQNGEDQQFGRFSVPFFFEPGEMCMVKCIDDPEEVEGIMYGNHVRAKMKTWVEFQDDSDEHLES